MTPAMEMFSACSAKKKKADSAETKAKSNQMHFKFKFNRIK